MELGLDGHTALVMGASRGIGYHIAGTLATEGSELGMFAKGKGRLKAAADRIHSVSGKHPVTLAGDSTSREDVENTIREVHRRFGRIDILVNCVGGYTPGTFMGLTDEAWTELIDTKLMGYIRAMRAVVPVMQEQGGGRILNLAGNSGKSSGNPHAGAVNSSVMNVSKTLSDEVAGDGILVNCICPGMTWTEHSKHIIEAQAESKGVTYEEMVDQTAGKIPLGFLGDPGDIAELAAFLVSSRNRWITGTAISVDGGTIRSVF